MNTKFISVSDGYYYKNAWHEDKAYNMKSVV